MFAFQLVADALGETLAQGKARWDQAQQRLRRRELQLPPTTKVKPSGKRQKTPQLSANDAAKALAMVLKDPLEEFFEKEEKLAWLRTQVQTAGGDPVTVDLTLTELLAEKAQREVDAQSLVLPGLHMGGAEMALRTTREGEEVLGSILDYLRWLGVEDEQGHTWVNWLREEFRHSLDSVTSNATAKILYVEKVFPGQHTQTPFTNFAGYRLLTKLCLHKSKIAQGMYDQALVVLGRVSVGDQRLHETLDANAASSSGEVRSFVLGAAEASAQEVSVKQVTKSAKSSPLDLVDFERKILEDVEVDAEVAARQLAKVALARQFRESSHQQLALIKRQKVADIEKYEAETKAEKEKYEAETCAAKEAAVEKLHAQRDQTQVERARIQAERQQVEDDARASREEREWQRIHTSELAAEKRRVEIREAAAKGLIAQAAAEEMLGENRQTLILRLEEWIRTRCNCPDASSCSSLLSRKFNEEVEAGRHTKPASHRNEAGRWKYFLEHDGSVLARLHQQIHDRRNGVAPGQSRLSF
jgi:hypothetical protein